uniref:Ripening-related protein grip22 n=1 Tax=Aegilops tauschii subsp. strangulata TaxID=200361 RepID=A0A452YKZ6_AEGTS
MANAKLVVMAILVILLQVSTCAVARHHAKPDPGGRGGTPGVMTVNGFEKGQEGGPPSECDGKFHSNKDMIVALSTRWYAGGRRCGKMINITSKHNGRTVQAKVVDECDSNHGCKTNIVDTSEAVWKALGLDSNIGEVPVTWSDA